MGRLVAIALPGGPAFVDAVRRAWDVGDAVLPLDPRAPERHRRTLLEAMGPAVLVDEGGTHRLGGAFPTEDGDAVVITTSGTTGAPKGAVHTHAAVQLSARMTSAALGVEPDAVWLACLPLWHVGGLSVITRALHTDRGLVVHDGFDAAAVHDAARAGATHVSLVPTVLPRIEAGLWRRILLGGSAIPARRPENTVATYGMTETFGGVVYDGVPLGGVEVRVAGAPVGGPASSGVLEIRSPTLLRCYRDGVDPADPHGWFRTGDVGRIGVGPRVVVEGRADDVIVSGGEKVWPEPVERRLEAHDGVSEAAVVGRDDPEWGHRVVALVVAADPHHAPSLEALRDWVRQDLPASCAPRELELVASLPRTALGKLARHILRGAGTSSTSPGAPPATTRSGND